MPLYSEQNELHMWHTLRQAKENYFVTMSYYKFLVVFYWFFIVSWGGIYIYIEIHLCWPLWFQSELPNLRKPHGTLKIEACIITCSNAQIRVQIQVVNLDSTYITLSTNRDFKYSIICHDKTPMYCHYLWRKDGGSMYHKYFCCWMRILA
jgi:hypothetical protein